MSEFETKLFKASDLTVIQPESIVDAHEIALWIAMMDRAFARGFFEDCENAHQNYVRMKRQLARLEGH